MPNEQQRIREIADQLHELGYPIVETEFRLPDNMRAQADVVAWASDDMGELVPCLAIEIKRGQRPETALPQLARVRSSLGTTEHYVVTDDGWFQAGQGLRTLQPVVGPPSARGLPRGTLKSIKLATKMMSRRVWALSDRSRNRHSRSSTLDAFVEGTSGSADGTQIQLTNGELVTVDPDVLWHARRAVLTELAERDSAVGPLVSPKAVSTAIGSLVGDRLNGKIVDPFCGSGSFLWSLQERAAREGCSTETVGRDIDPHVLRAASLIGQSAPRRVTFQQGDAFSEDLPEADVIVTAPPMGLSLSHPYELANGDRTKQVDVAAIDASLRALKPGGRAVFQLAPGITFQKATASYRKYLANEYRVAALIGCPSGSVFASSIQSVLLVVDKMPAGETFVAQLAEDWETQLAPDGPVMLEALAYIDGKQV
ncbi:N-6 DNA methylase [Paenarthrobacter sp. NPDC090522]|uniref:N-6 DNA methylase n=1 Tax=Paenarthrobacter sp. NPDC090522 TaxID=3364383 RepID=UPI0038212ADA